MAPEGQAEPQSKRGLLEPSLCHGRAAAASQLPESLPKARALPTAFPCMAASRCMSSCWLSLGASPHCNKLGQTAPAPLEQHKAAACTRQYPPRGENVPQTCPRHAPDMPSCSALSKKSVVLLFLLSFSLKSSPSSPLSPVTPTGSTEPCPGHSCARGCWITP